MANQSADTRYRENWQREIDGIALYTALAAAEPDPVRAAIYRQLATAEERHAALWAARLRAGGHDLPPARPGWRVHVLSWMARRLGPAWVLPVMVEQEHTDSRRYDGQAEAQQAGLAAEERRHAQVLGTLRNGAAADTPGRPERRHRTIGGNALRAAVLGANDGLVSNLSLVMGVAGAALPGQTILITGLAGLLAGAFSMALGEWLSVQSSRELYTRQIDLERQELAEAPELEAAELVQIYQAKGLGEAQARDVVATLMQNPQSALDTMAREELGVDPGELGGSAWVAAATSFGLFRLGAIIPVLPYLLRGGGAATVASLAGSAVGLFIIGAGITLLTGRNGLFSGLRPVIFGLVAAGLTFLVGRLIGVSIGG